MNRPSKRFNPSRWMERLVPILLVILAIGLLATILIIILAVLGIIP
jgi:uncharacterized membrane protein